MGKLSKELSVKQKGNIKIYNYLDGSGVWKRKAPSALSAVLSWSWPQTTELWSGCGGIFQQIVLPLQYWLPEKVYMSGTKCHLKATSNVDLSTDNIFFRLFTSGLGACWCLVTMQTSCQIIVCVFLGRLSANWAFSLATRTYLAVVLNELSWAKKKIPLSTGHAGEVFMVWDGMSKPTKAGSWQQAHNTE